MACEFLSSQKLLQLLHQQTPYQLELMLIYNAILKLAELVPHLFLFSSRNSVVLDIYLGKRRTIEPLLTMLLLQILKKEPQEQNGNPLGASEHAHAFFQHVLFPLHKKFNK